jgi:hypothetical protein
MGFCAAKRILRRNEQTHPSNQRTNRIGMGILKDRKALMVHHQTQIHQTLLGTP